MNIVGVISSANHDGNSATLVRACLAGARAEGAVTSEIFLPEWKLEFCQGCSRCMAEGRCWQADDFEKLRALLLQADGLVLGTPTFAEAPNARMKNVIDRLGLFTQFTSSLGGKYLVGISTASSPSAARKVARSLAVLLARGVFLRGYVSGSLGAKAMPKGKPADSGAAARAEQLGRKLAVDIRQRNTYPLQNLAGRLLTGLVMRPLFRKAIIQYKDGAMKGVYANLAARGIIS